MKFVGILTLLLFLVSQVGCKDVLNGRLEPTKVDNHALKLYEATSGNLIELSPGTATINIEPSFSFFDLLKGDTEAIRFIVKQGEKKFFFFLRREDLKPDGNFELDEVNSGQPVRIKGQLTVSNENTDSSFLEVKIFKGFSRSEEPIWQFHSSPLEADLIAKIKAAGPEQPQAAL